MTGGRDGARNALHSFWKRVADAATFSPFQRSPVDRMMGRWSLDYSQHTLQRISSRALSPPILSGRLDRIPFEIFLRSLSISSVCRRAA